MKNATPLALGLGLLAGLLASACVSQLEVKPCTVDRDCSAGQTCIEQRCTDGAQTGCSVDADCAGALAAASPMPPGCAEARCVSGSCALRAKDADGDGERAARCTGNGAIEVGTDCDDRPDAGFAINRRATETCAPDGVDENCNGTVNEGCGCPVLGAQTACCSGRGTQRCEAIDGGGAALTACTAPVGPEACNGLDDDCNGQVDDAVVLDPDAGTLAFDGGVVQPDGTCAVGVGACARQGTFTCSAGALGCSATPGDAGTETCNGLDDNCDGTTDEGLTQRCLPDEDNDRYATSTVSQQQCPESTRPTFGNCPSGFVAPGSSLGVDCAPADAGTFRSVPLQTDADGDRRCVGPAVATCIGDLAPLGQRISADCLGIDCADTNAALYQVLPLRTDGDGDGFCVGAATNQCVGAAAPGGQRLASACNATDDCKDTNPLANQVCFIGAGYLTNPQSRNCNLFSSGSQDFPVVPTQQCPAGFSLVNVRAEGGPGTCQALNPTFLRETCPPGGATVTINCRIVGDCQAN
jgi:hypothetical protein